MIRRCGLSIYCTLFYILRNLLPGYCQEELAVKVLEFLESPKETRDVVIADQEKVLLDSVHYCSKCSFSKGALKSFAAGEKAQEYTKKGEIWRIFGHPSQGLYFVIISVILFVFLPATGAFYDLFAYIFLI